MLKLFPPRKVETTNNLSFSKYVWYQFCDFDFPHCCFVVVVLLSKSKYYPCPPHFSVSVFQGFFSSGGLKALKTASIFFFLPFFFSSFLCFLLPFYVSVFLPFFLFFPLSLLRILVNFAKLQDNNGKKILAISSFVWKRENWNHLRRRSAFATLESFSFSIRKSISKSEIHITAFLYIYISYWKSCNIASFYSYAVSENSSEVTEMTRKTR